jgi:non-ribosomal peptide synthase protein (TIGR01720 family)
VPTLFRRVAALPLTANGKLDREALARIAEPLDAQAPYEAPRNDVEATLCDVWQQVLGGARIGRDDNLFDRGGDSIKALTIAARAERAGLRITVRDVLETQTVAALAPRCSRIDDLTTATASVNPADEIETGPKPRTPMEAWFVAQAFAEPQRYAHTVLLRFTTRASVEALQDALSAIVAHHDALRLTWDASLGQCRLDAARPAPRALLTTISVADANADAGARAGARSDAGAGAGADTAAAAAAAADSDDRTWARRAAEQCASIDLANGPLLHARLVSSSESDHLLLTVHHLAIDGVSWRIVLDDLEAAYRAHLDGGTARLPRRGTSIAAHARALDDYSRSPRLLEQGAYWRDVHRSAVALSVDAGHTEPHHTEPHHAEPGPTPAFDEHRFELDAALTTTLLRTASRTYHSDPGLFVLTALLRQVTCETGRDAHTIELEQHGRTGDMADELDLTRTVGWLTAIAPAVLRLPAGSTSDQLKSIKEQVRGSRSPIAYGVLRELARDADLQTPYRAAARVNYLGQFEVDSRDAAPWQPIDIFSGDLDAAPSGPRSSDLQVDALVRGERLLVIVRGPSPISSRAETLRHHLHSVVEDAAREAQVQFTPSDFDTVPIGQRELDEMLT